MNNTEITCLSIFIIILFNLLVVGICLYNKIKYEESTYFQITKIPFWHIGHDVGHYGEFLIYDYLKDMELEGTKFLFNYNQKNFFRGEFFHRKIILNEVYIVN